MIIRILPQTPRRGNERIAQGDALGDALGDAVLAFQAAMLVANDARSSADRSSDNNG